MESCRDAQNSYDIKGEGECNDINLKLYHISILGNLLESIRAAPILLCLLFYAAIIDFSMNRNVILLFF